MLASHVGESLEGCSWVGIAFAGGMSEVPHITARTILVNDLHRHIINLARVVADSRTRGELIRRLKRKAYHPDELKAAQQVCKSTEPADWIPPNEDRNLLCAEAYFVCCWMARASKAGIDDEFNGRPSVRWKSDGGDSMVRFRSAIRMLGNFSRALRRCTFETMDALTEFLPRCEDIDGHGIYADPPFPGAGQRYKHNAGVGAEEVAWHTRLRDALVRFERTRVVCRFYDHPLIQSLYPGEVWDWHRLTGRKQSNDDAPEVLLVRNGRPGLFS